MALTNAAGLERADLGDLASRHHRVESPCGYTREGGEPDHWVESCACGQTTEATGDPHTFVWENHVREVIRESLNLTRASLVRLLDIEPGERDVEAYRARAIAEVNWVFADIGADVHEAR